MTVAQMEQRLLQLSAEFAKTRHPSIRKEYKRLHTEWKRAKEAEA